MGRFRTIGRHLLHLLLPQTCAHCREDLPTNWPEPLCASCRKGLVAVESPFCLRCSEPVSAGRGFCSACGQRPHACRLIRAAFLYRGPIPSLVHAFKYRGRVGAARSAGRWLAEHWQRFPELGGCDTLVPVPLHPKRLRERGYNQAALLAAELFLTSGMPVRDLLQRRRATRPQWNLDQARRRRNLAGAFLAGPEAQGKIPLLIDDVCTSGTSLEECAQALLAAGALGVYAYVFARQTLADQK